MGEGGRESLDGSGSILDISQAVFARDALGKAIYDRLFTWLVGRINDSIKVRGYDRL